LPATRHPHRKKFWRGSACRKTPAAYSVMR
jgi:hypothetical protein